MMLVLSALVAGLLTELFTLEQATLKPLTEFAVERIERLQLRLRIELDAGYLPGYFERVTIVLGRQVDFDAARAGDQGG